MKGYKLKDDTNKRCDFTECTVKDMKCCPATTRAVIRGRRIKGQ